MWPLMLTATVMAGTQRFALLAAANDGGIGRATLRYAEDDANEMAAVLNELGGVPVEHTLMLTEPSVAELRAGWQQISEWVDVAEAQGDRTEVFVYYSGHSDIEGLLLGGQRYGYDRLRGDLKGIPSDFQLLVLDSCSSGAVARAKGGSFQPSFLDNEAVNVQGYVYMASSAADELSQEADNIGGSFFTHYLVSGLRGAADYDQNLQVSLSEAYTFAERETLARTQRSLTGAQHATHNIQTTGHGDVVFTDLNEINSQLTLDRDVAGRLFIHDHDGDLILELQKTPEQSITLGLPDGRYRLFLQDAQGQSAEANIDLNDGEKLTVDTGQFLASSPALAMFRAKGGDVDYRKVFGRFTIFPIDSFRKNRDPELHRLDASFTLNRADALNGAQFSLGANHVTNHVRGYQGSLGANFAGSVLGIQNTLGANITSGDLKGTQLSLGANIAGGSVQGMQLALGVNTARNVVGTQFSIGGNMAKDVYGLQGSIGFSWAASIHGAQWSIGPAVARDVYGLQAAFITLARNDVNGAQLGFINVARRADVQVGVINVAGKDADVQLGLINVNPGGYNQLYVAGSTVEGGGLGVTYGGRKLYTLAEISTEMDRLRYGMGLGVHVERDFKWMDYIDFDATATSSFDLDSPFSGEQTLTTRLRLLAGYTLDKDDRFALFGGPTVDYAIIASQPLQNLLGEDYQAGDVGIGGTLGVAWRL
ncbi:MAG: caspase family protein [Myxococcota bacterium]